MYESEEDMYNSVVKLLGKLPVLVAWTLRKEAMAYRLDYGDELIWVMSKIYLKMMFNKPNEVYVQNPSCS